MSSESKKEILKKYKALLQAGQNVLNSQDIRLIKRAFNLAIENREESTLRERTEIEVHYLLDIAKIVLSEINLGRVSVICSILYDIIKRKEIAVSEINKMFGDSVAKIYANLIEVRKIYTKNVSVESENFRKLLLTFTQDIRVILIIIAERLQVMRCLEKFTQAQQLEIANEVKALYIPFAHRLGLYTIKSELEDITLKYLSPTTFRYVNNKLLETKIERNKFIDEFILPIKTELKQAKLDVKIKKRVKSISSIHDKMEKQSIRFEEVYDLFAVRIIINSQRENEKYICWKVYSIITNIYQSNIDRLRDWISVPKSSGYESLHITVFGPRKKWVEVQIRTNRMDEIAEKGLAAHWKYKGHKEDEKTDEVINSIRNILESPDVNVTDFLNDFKLNLYDNEIFVFTPNGDLKELPKGATVLDFAYSIHTDIGSKCIGGKVNDKNVAIKYKLHSGDIVSISTFKNQKPTNNWLYYAITDRAKSKIRQSLREQKLKETILGKELLIRRLKNWKIEINKNTFSTAIKHLKYSNVTDFFYDVVHNKINIYKIKNIFRHENSNEKIKIEKEKTINESDKIQKREKEGKNISPKDRLVFDKNMLGIAYSFSQCCNPIFGDNIFGFTSIKGGIKIHRNVCPNAKELTGKYPYRIIKVKWRGEKEGALQTDIRVIGKDTLGIVNEITDVISKNLKVNMRSISFSTDKGNVEGIVSVFTIDARHIETLKIELEKIQGVNKVDYFHTSKL